MPAGDRKAAIAAAGDAAAGAVEMPSTLHRMPTAGFAFARTQAARKATDRRRRYGASLRSIARAAVIIAAEVRSTRGQGGRRDAGRRRCGLRYAQWFVATLRCPRTGLGYHDRDGHLVRADGQPLAEPGGLPSFVTTEALTGLDLRMHRRYEWLAPYYDFGERVLGRLLTGLDLRAGREAMIDQCGFRPDGVVLEVSPGPGVFLTPLRRVLGVRSRFVALDLSLPMLAQYRQRPDAGGVELVHGDAQALPFADASFDALFHFGGINLFNDPPRALREFVRVVKPGGRLAWGDERMSESFRHPVGRRLLPLMNPGFGRVPPAPPPGLIDLEYREVYAGLGYLYLATRDGSALAAR